MSEATPTAEEFRAWVKWVVEGADADPSQVLAEYSRMIAEVERAAAEKALTDAAVEEEQVSQQYAITADGMREREEWADSNRYANYASGHASAAHALRARAVALGQTAG